MTEQDQQPDDKQSLHRGRAGMILSVGVAAALVILSSAAVVIVLNGDSLTESGTAMLSTTLGTAIGAIATYLGGNKASDTPTQQIYVPDSYVGKHREDSGNGDDSQDTSR